MTEQHDEEATVIRPRRSAPSSAPAQPGDGVEDAEATVIRLIEPRPPAPRPLLPIEPLAVMPPGPIAAAPADRAPADSAPDDPAPSSARWAVRVRGTATVVPLDRPVIVGRRPGAARPGEHPEPRRLVVPADCADVSSRHARIEQVGETLVVADLGSTNGVVVHWSNGAPRRLRPGESSAVLPDATVELGERLLIEFVSAP